MDKHILRPAVPVKQDAPFLVNRVSIAGDSSPLADAHTFEQACDLARSDRARLRDMHQIELLERHDVMTRSTGQVRPILVPR